MLAARTRFVFGVGRHFILPCLFLVSSCQPTRSAMSSWDRRVWAFRSRDAAALVEREGGVEHLALTSATPLKEPRLRTGPEGVPGTDDGGNADERRGFHQLVTALERDRTMREIHFEHQDFVGPSDQGPTAADGRRSIRTSYLSEGDVHRLFGEVLPRHPALRSLTLYRCRVPPRAFRGLITALPSAASRISELSISYIPIGTEGVRTVADLLRQNYPLRVLLLQGWKGEDDDDEEKGRRDSSTSGGPPPSVDACRIICDAAATNPHMRTLVLGDMTIGRGATRQALGLASGLRELYVRGDWTTGPFVEALRHLRRNEVLERFIVMLPSEAQPTARDFPGDAMVELLRTYNSTLTAVQTHDLGIDAETEARIAELLRLNARVRRVRDRLRETNYSVENKGTWPRVLDRVGRFPTLVYRFVRVGNAPAFSAQVLAASRASRKRGAGP
jgi:hypothetical protein